MIELKNALYKSFSRNYKCKFMFNRLGFLSQKTEEMITEVIIRELLQQFRLEI